MRRYSVLLIALTVVTSLFLVGCPPRKPKLSVSTSVLRFNAGETQKTFTVKNSGASFTRLSFTVSADKAWVTVSPTSGVSRRASELVEVTVTISRYSAPKAAFTAGTVTVASNAGTRNVTLTVEPDFFTEEFGDTNEFDLHGTQLVFASTEGGTDYDAASVDASVFGTDPAGGAVADFNVSDPYPVTLASGQVWLYGTGYDTLYIGSNGTLSFGPEAATNTGALTLDGHFAIPRISGLRTNLDPAVGTVSYLETPAHVVAVSYEDVSVVGAPGVLYDFQIEMMPDGVIRLTYLDGGTPSAVVGLSGGGGIPDGFVPSDLTAYNTDSLKAAP